MMMTKSDTIEAIVTLNPTADRMFLSEFSNAQLAEYLQRISDVPTVRTAIAEPHACDTEMASRTLVGTLSHA